MASIWPVGKWSLINTDLGYLVSELWKEIKGFTNPRPTFCHAPLIQAMKLSKIFIFVKVFKNIMHQLLPIFRIGNIVWIT